MKRLTAMIGAATLAAGLALTPAMSLAQAAPVSTAVVAALPSSSTSGFPVLKVGVGKSNAVKIVQVIVGTGADGSFGPATKAAVIKFQGANGLSKDGVVGPKTWAKMLDVVKSGSKGRAVKAVQMRLGISQDGSFGPKTKEAVLAFQKKYGLSRDGVVGPGTWAELVRVGGPVKPGGSGPDTKFPNPKATYDNGEVPASQLCTIPGASSEWRISCRAMPDYKRLAAAYKAHFGSTMTVTHLKMTTYRTVADQRYLYNKLGPKQAAVPGTSNHGWGLSIDVKVGGWGSAEQKWMWANAPKYGFKPDVPHEQWHFTYQR